MDKGIGVVPDATRDMLALYGLVLPPPGPSTTGGVEDDTFAAYVDHIPGASLGVEYMVGTALAPLIETAESPDLLIIRDFDPSLIATALHLEPGEPLNMLDITKKKRKKRRKDSVGNAGPSARKKRKQDAFDLVID